MDITIADGEPFIPGDYSLGDTFFGTIPGAPWAWPTQVGAVRRNPARPAGVTVLDRRVTARTHRVAQFAVRWNRTMQRVSNTPTARANRRAFGVPE